MAALMVSASDSRPRRVRLRRVLDFWPTPSWIRISAYGLRYSPSINIGKSVNVRMQKNKPNKKYNTRRRDIASMLLASMNYDAVTV